MQRPGNNYIGGRSLCQVIAGQVSELVKLVFNCKENKMLMKIFKMIHKMTRLTCCWNFDQPKSWQIRQESYATREVKDGNEKLPEEQYQGVYVWSEELCLNC